MAKIIMCSKSLTSSLSQQIMCHHLIPEADVRVIKKPAGDIFELEDLSAALEEHRPAVLFLVQGESSTGALQPIKGVGPLCRK